jgi:hypothetical protein
MSIGKYLLSGLLLIGCVAALTAQPPPPPTALQPVRFPIATEDGAPLIVPVTIQGKQYSFVLDTGASTSLYDRSLRPLMGERLGSTQGCTPQGKVKVEVRRPPAASVGGLPLHSPFAFVHDLRRFREVTGIEIAGILGMDFLQQHVLEIDFDRGTLALGPSPARKRGAGMPLTFRSDRPCFELPLLNRREQFVIDTGFAGHSSMSLRRPLYAELLAAGRIRETVSNATSLTLGKTVTKKMPCGRLTSLSVGKHEVRDVDLSGELSQNIVGVGLLRRFRVTFDFPEGKLYLEPGKRIDRPNTSNHSGLLLMRRDGATVIEAVCETGPGAKSGLRARDVLLELNGARADRGSLFKLYNQLSVPGATVRARVRRGEQEIEATLRLSDER